MTKPIRSGREIDNAPPVLNVRGTLKIEDEWGGAELGAYPVYGPGSGSIATKLVSSGITIISGLALGVDTIAQQAALDEGGRTLAGLQCRSHLPASQPSVGRVYPNKWCLDQRLPTRNTPGGE